jgi:hypothetical protein
MRRRSNPSNRALETELTRDDLHEWILGLPWVVERPFAIGAPRVRTFAIACEPLDVRQLWLVTGLPNGGGVAVIVPRPVADRLAREGLGRTLTPMSAGHALFAVWSDAGRTETERVILESYGTILS